MMTLVLSGMFLLAVIGAMFLIGVAVGLGWFAAERFFDAFDREHPVRRGGAS